MTFLRMGNNNRTTESTNANEASSRSHAILQVIMEYRDKFSGVETELSFAKLSLIDLAGSERASATHNKGARL
jgi:kinesin family protein 18/19